MSEIKPNHICKNPNCRKEYYACNYCSRTLSWRSIACSKKCYQEYTDLIIAERSKGKTIDIKPERTDMTEKEVNKLLEQPIDEVLKATKAELKDYVSEDGSINIAEAVDDINEKIEKKKITTRSKKKKNIENE